MPFLETSLDRPMVLALVIFVVATVVVSCGGSSSMDNPRLYGDKQPAIINLGNLDSEEAGEETTASAPLAYASTGGEDSSQTSDEPAATDDESTKPEKKTEAPKPEVKKPTGNYSLTRGSSGRDGIEMLVYYGEVDNEDSASAVDDAVWRLLDLADEYHSMGVVANREASWEEAQYYFEKAVKIMAGLDIEAGQSLHYLFPDGGPRSLHQVSDTFEEVHSDIQGNPGQAQPASGSGISFTGGVRFQSESVLLGASFWIVAVYSLYRKDVWSES